MERNTGFEPATFALATRQPGLHDPPLPSTNQHDPASSLESSDGPAKPSSTIRHEGSLASCAQRVPGRRLRDRGASADVTQVAQLLGCSTPNVYHRCEQGKLPYYRDIHNAIGFDCRVLGTFLRSAITANP